VFIILQGPPSSLKSVAGNFSVSGVGRIFHKLWLQQKSFGRQKMKMARLEAGDRPAPNALFGDWRLTWGRSTPHKLTILP